MEDDDDAFLYGSEEPVVPSKPSQLVFNELENSNDLSPARLSF